MVIQFNCNKIKRNYYHSCPLVEPMYKGITGIINYKPKLKTSFIHRIEPLY